MAELENEKLDFDLFKKHHIKADKKTLLSLAFDWYSHAHLSKEALDVVIDSNINLGAINDHIYELLETNGLLDKLSLETIEVYKEKRKSELAEAKSIDKLGMLINEEISARSSLSENARKGGRARANNDPINKYKDAIKKHFTDSNYPFDKNGYITKFANEMMEKYQNLSRVETIKEWIREWLK